MKTLDYIKESPYSKEVQYSVYTILFIENPSLVDSIKSVDKIEYDVIDKGLFIGGIANPLLKEKVNSVDDLARAYYREMLVGNVFDLPNKEFVSKFKKLYEEATTQI
jgi:hypothetical protein